jgi:hypothetical protein
VTDPVGNVRPSGGESIEARFAAYEQRLRALEQRGATNLGRVSVTDPDGNAALYIGPDPDGSVRDDGQTPWRVLMQRDGGAKIFGTRTTILTETGVFRQFWELTDSTGRIVMSDDAYTGEGLATPWSPFHMMPQFSMNALQQWDYMTIDAGFTHTEKNIWRGRIPRVSHPKAEFSVTTGIASGSPGTPTYRIYFDNEATPRITWSTASGSVVSTQTCSIKDLLDRKWIDVQMTVIASGTSAQIAAHCHGATQRQS